MIFTTARLFLPRTWTWAEVEAQKQAALMAMVARFQLRAKVLAPTLPNCPLESQHLTPGGGPGYCYGGNLANDEAQLVPGSFSVFGVGFNLADVQNGGGGRFDRTFIPDADQRFWIDYYIAQTSRDRIQGLIDSHHNQEQMLAMGNSAVLVLIDQRYRNMSISDIQNLVPEVRTSLNNFSLNPIAPTNAEFTGKGGWKAWLARGGYALSNEIAEGRVPMYRRVGISACTSILCNCNGNISCTQAWLEKDGLTTTPKETSGGWLPYVSIAQPNGQVHFALVYQDASWYERAAASVGSVLRDIAFRLCGIQPTVAAQVGTLTQEKCVNAKGAPCAKGSVGCTCVAPNATTQMSVNALNIATSKWCADWGQEFGPAPTVPPPTPSTDSPLAPSPAASSYPPGTIAAFDPKIQLFRIATPISATLTGLAAAVPTHVIASETPASVPSGVSQVSLTEFQQATGTLPITKQPLFWVAVGVGVIAAGGGGYALYRRRRRLTR